MDSTGWFPADSLDDVHAAGEWRRPEECPRVAATTGGRSHLVETCNVHDRTYAPRRGVHVLRPLRPVRRPEPGNGTGSEAAALRRPDLRRRRPVPRAPDVVGRAARGPHRVGGPPRAGAEPVRGGGPVRPPRGVPRRLLGG